VDDVWIAIIGCLLVLGAITLIGMAMRGRQRLRELAVRERIAMIERGLMPSPELDPERFDRGLLLAAALQRASNPKGLRYRTMGVMLMGLGAALFLLLTFAAGVADIAFGVAGGVFVLGLAAYFNGVLVSRDAPPSSPLPVVRPSVAASPITPEPPDNIAP
jgi:hypothetical protein